MEVLRRLDIVAWRGRHMVVVESEVLPRDPAVVVIPLLADYPAVRHLNPRIACQGCDLVLATRLIGAVRRAEVQRVGSAVAQADEITRAVDVLLAGF
jgi:toxin CcdB